MKSNASLVYGLVLVVGDFLALVAAFVLAYLIRGDFSNVPVAHPIAGTTYLHIFLLLLPFWILLFGLLGLYSNSIQEKRFVELGRLVLGSFIGLLFVTSYAYFSNRVVFPSKLVPIYGFALAFIFLAIFRNVARALRAWLYGYGFGITNLLLVGNTKITIELIEFLSDYRILEYAQTKHIAYRFVPGNSELFVGNIAVELFRSQIPVIAVHQTALIGWGRIVKRLLDILISAVLLVPGLPLMLIIAVLIKLSDLRAPIFFKDPRLTRFGGIAKIYKFRSHKRAYTGLPPEEAFVKLGQPELLKKYREAGDQIPNDPRVSRIGGFLRRTSLDELPQLVNILKGDISFVGPRALQPHELEQHAKKDLILAVKSGLTGLAQISGRRDITVSERRKLDLYYVQNWSLWLDMTIMLKTIRVVAGRIGAK
jgi:lipopolysaccharide/colanic/teichoic acid biosynthesis glycosyltransferase